MSVPEENWENEPLDDGLLDFGFAIGHLTINVHSGGQMSVIVGGKSIQVTQEQQIVEGDWNSLEQNLTQLGLSAQDVAALKEALAEDGDREGEATRGWFGRIAAKIPEGVLTGVAVDAIVKAVRGFLGV